MRVCAYWGFQVKCSAVLQPSASLLPWNPRRHCDVCVNSFTALRPPQLPSPLFITATEVIPAPHSLPKLLPHRRPIAALRVRWKCTIVGQKRGDIPTSSWVRPRVLYHRREASEITAYSLRVSTACVCVKRQEWAAEADSPTQTPEGKLHRNMTNSHFRLSFKIWPWRSWPIIGHLFIRNIFMDKRQRISYKFSFLNKKKYEV